MAFIESSSVYIFRGEVLTNQSSSMSGTLSAEVSAHLETIHTGSLISINTSVIPTTSYIELGKDNHKTEVVVTIVHISGSGHTYMNQA
jgi:hypothetical protein